MIRYPVTSEAFCHRGTANVAVAPATCADRAGRVGPCARRCQPGPRQSAPRQAVPPSRSADTCPRRASWLAAARPDSGSERNGSPALSRGRLSFHGGIGKSARLGSRSVKTSATEPGSHEDRPATHAARPAVPLSPTVPCSSVVIVASAMNMNAALTQARATSAIDGRRIRRHSTRARAGITASAQSTWKYSQRT